MGFKEQMEKDLGLFFNKDEFAEIHSIDGRQIAVIVDNDRLTYRSKKEFEGISVGELLYYAPTSAFERRPKPGDAQKFDSRLYQVFDVREDTGMLEIILSRNEV